MCLSRVRSATRRFRRLFFVLEPSQPARLADAQVAVLLFPDVERGITDPELPAKVTNGGADIGLSNRVDDLFLRKLRPLHGSPPFVRDRRSW